MGIFISPDLRSFRIYLKNFFSSPPPAAKRKGIFRDTPETPFRGISPENPVWLSPRF
jgi:hypothetical protein